MTKPGSLVETTDARWQSQAHGALPPVSGMADPRRPVSVFGHRRILPGARLPAPDDGALRSALLPVRHDRDRLWADLPEFRLDLAAAAMAHLIVTHHEDPVGLLYDHLRTRMLQALQEHGWNRVAVAAPRRGCGASTVAANLALALARRPSGRTLLMDLDLRAPSLATLFGMQEPGVLRDVLSGAQPMESHMWRLGRNLVLGFNGRPETGSAELLQEPATADALEAILEDLAPDVALYDLPPVLEADDVLAILPEVDALLLVADGTLSTAADIRECERLIKDRTHLLGVVLNRAEDSPAGTHRAKG